MNDEPHGFKVDCGHLAIPKKLATGYATLPDGRRVCYSCADDLQRDDVRDAQPGDRITLYESSDGTRITTWTDGTVMRVLRHGARHNFSRERRYVTAIDELGRVWSGTSAPGMWATLRLTREVSR